MSSAEVIVPVRRITPDDGQHYFFGYYDIPTWTTAGDKHLCQRVGFMDRRPKPDDVAQLGLIEVAKGTFSPLAETTAWNFQQGSFLQWNPAAPDREIIFNRRDGERYVGVVRDVKTGNERVLSRPLASVSPTGRQGLSINFSRMYDFRPGYGYAGIPDAFTNEPQPDNDGIFLVDLATGASRLVLSLAQIAALHPDATAGRKLLINHITFNTDGTRFMCLPRTFPQGKGGWLTGLISADADGGNVYAWGPYAMYSHYHWRDPRHLLVWASIEGKNGLYVLKDRTQECELVDPAFFVRDGHCSYSPDRRWVLYDSYPMENFRHLYLYDLTRKRGFTLGKFHGPNPADHDIRCDLHPRWSPTGRAVSFDSLHEGRRHVYVADVSSIVG